MRSFVETIRSLWKDPMGKIGIIGILLLIFMALFAGQLAPYPYDAALKADTPLMAPMTASA